MRATNLMFKNINAKKLSKFNFFLLIKDGTLITNFYTICEQKFDY